MTDRRTPACADDDVAVKSFFLGPCAENGEWLQRRLVELLHHWFETRREISEGDGSVIPRADRANAAFLRRQATMEEKTRELMERFARELPKFSPRYMGHMFSELSMPALLGHWVALLQNPNNISKEASHVGLEIEREAVRMLLEMFGFDADHGTGHFTSGGTVANFEAVLRARARQRLWIALGARLREKEGSRISMFEAAHMGWDAFYEALPGESDRRDFLARSDALIHGENFIGEMERVYDEKWKTPVLIVSAGAHYSWIKAADFFGISREAVIENPLDARGRLDIAQLSKMLGELETRRRPVMMAVTLAGSTELGTVDPIGEAARAIRESGFQRIWHHVDAAFGGFFACSVEGDTIERSVRLSLRAIREADSVTVDPHKMGYVPYASGVFLCADKRDYPHHRIDAPYIDFDDGADPGLQTLEGSRAATGAAATWLTGRAIGFDGNGYGRILGRTVEAKLALETKLREAFGGSVLIPAGLDLNIACFALRPESRISAMNRATQSIFDASGTPAFDGFSVAKTVMKLDSSRDHLRHWLIPNGIEIDQDRIVLIRSCLMNPFLTSRQARVDFLSDFIQAISRRFEAHCQSTRVGIR